MLPSASVQTAVIQLMEGGLLCLLGTPEWTVIVLRQHLVVVSPKGPVSLCIVACVTGQQWHHSIDTASQQLCHATTTSAVSMMSGVHKPQHSLLES